VPSELLQQKRANLVADAVGKDEESVDKEDEAVVDVRVGLVEVTEHVDRNVSPQEEAPEVDHEEHTADNCHNATSMVISLLL